MQFPSGANLDHKMPQFLWCAILTVSNAAEGPRIDNSYSETLTPGQGLELNSDTNFTVPKVVGEQPEYPVTSSNPKC